MGDSSTLFSGLGGLFNGFQNGLQLLLALQKAEEDRKIRQGALDVDRGHLKLAQDQFQAGEADKPLLNIQGKVLDKQNVTASLPDIAREYTPPAEGDTFQPTKEFAPPAFGSTPPAGPVGKPGLVGSLDYSGKTQRSVPSLDSSHIGQVLERANRYSNFNAKQDILTSTLAAAGREAQRTQAPVAGHFGSGADEGQLPQGFSAQPDKTFSPYQLDGRPDPLDNIFGPLLNHPVDLMILEGTAKNNPNGEEAATLRAFQAWKVRRLSGAGAGGGSPAPAPQPQAPVSTHQQRRGFGNPGFKPTGTGRPPADSTQAPPQNYKGKSIAQWISEVKADSAFANASPQEIAAEAKRRAGAP